MFGRFCAEVVINEVRTIAIEKWKKRQSIFIEQQERSDQSAVEHIGCNSDFILKLDAARCELDSEGESITTSDLNSKRRDVER